MPGDSSGPDFLCIGMQKAGTLWLYDSLHGCPGFWMPPIKELHFFDRDFYESNARVRVDAANLRRCQEIVSGSPTGRWPAGSLHADMPNLRRDHDFAEAWIRMAGNGYQLDDYRALFPSRGLSLAGDVTPAYSALSDREVETVRSEFPQLKVVLLVRDPIARAWSAFNMYAIKELMPGEKNRRGRFITTLEEKATPEALVRFMGLPETRRRSFPSLTYDRWASAFGTLQVHVAFFQDILSRPEGVINDICTFLSAGLDSPPVPAQNVKAKRPRAEMTHEHKAFLGDYFREEYRAMRTLFPGKAGDWVG